MKNRHSLKMISFIALSLAGTMLSAHRAEAQEVGSLSYYNIPKSEYYDESTGQYKPEYYQWKIFLDYQLKQKPCGHYQDPPAGYVVRGCQVYRLEQPVASTQQADTQAAANVAPPAPAPVVAAKSYDPITIYFDFDKANIRNGENEKLNLIIDRITADHPSQVIIAGHTDTAGPNNYNVFLSQRRAKVVADALMKRGIQKDVIQEKAYGEKDLAVPTANNVPLQDNRRTVVLFVQ